PRAVRRRREKTDPCRGRAQDRRPHLRRAGRAAGAERGGDRPRRRVAREPRRDRARAQARAPHRGSAARAHTTIGAMNDLASFPITRKWPPRHPDRLQLYSLPTPNGVKVAIFLEETGLPYEPHRVA